MPNNKLPPRQFPDYAYANRTAAPSAYRMAGEAAARLFSPNHPTPAFSSGTGAGPGITGPQTVPDYGKQFGGQIGEALLSGIRNYRPQGRAAALPPAPQYGASGSWTENPHDKVPSMPPSPASLPRPMHDDLVQRNGQWGSTTASGQFVPMQGGSPGMQLLSSTGSQQSPPGPTPIKPVLGVPPQPNAQPLQLASTNLPPPPGSAPGSGSPGLPQPQQPASPVAPQLNPNGPNVSPYKMDGIRPYPQMQMQNPNPILNAFGHGASYDPSAQTAVENKARQGLERLPLTPEMQGRIDATMGRYQNAISGPTGGSTYTSAMNKNKATGGLLSDNQAYDVYRNSPADSRLMPGRTVGGQFGQTMRDPLGANKLTDQQVLGVARGRYASSGKPNDTGLLAAVNQAKGREGSALSGADRARLADRTGADGNLKPATDPEQLSRMAAAKGNLDQAYDRRHFGKGLPEDAKSDTPQQAYDRRAFQKQQDARQLAKDRAEGKTPTSWQKRDVAKQERNAKAAENLMAMRNPTAYAALQQGRGAQSLANSQFQANLQSQKDRLGLMERQGEAERGAKERMFNAGNTSRENIAKDERASREKLSETNLKASQEAQKERNRILQEEGKANRSSAEKRTETQFGNPTAQPVASRDLVKSAEEATNTDYGDMSEDEIKKSVAHLPEETQKRILDKVQTDRATRQAKRLGIDASGIGITNPLLRWFLGGAMGAQ